MKFHSCLLSIRSIPWQSQRPQPARLKVTRRSGKKQLGNSGAGSPSPRDLAVWEDQRRPAHHGLLACHCQSLCTPDTASQCSPWMGGSSDPANCSSELLPPARQAGLDISLGAGEGWSCTVGISEGGFPLAGHGVPGQVWCPGRAADTCSGARGRFLQVSLRDTPLQGRFIAKIPLLPQMSEPQPKGSWRDGALLATTTSWRAALGRGSALSW